MNPKLKEHLISAAQTFAAAFLTDFLFLTRDAEYLQDIGWEAVGSYALVTASRAVIKELVARGFKK